jgi:hypothetical protein
MPNGSLHGDIGKMSLYFRSLLDDLGIPQFNATVIFEDNRGALFMANAQQTSPRTRHIDIREFALVDWVQQDLLILENCRQLLRRNDQGTGKSAILLS